jgi:hypothetical protein
LLNLLHCAVAIIEIIALSSIGFVRPRYNLGVPPANKISAFKLRPPARALRIIALDVRKQPNEQTTRSPADGAIFGATRAPVGWRKKT